MSLKVLIVHNSYQQAGGEDAVVSNEKDLLKSAGYNVRLYSISNSEISGITKKIRAFVDINYSKKAKRDLAREIYSFQPDVVHVHNYFPLLTPSVFDACIDAGVPVVQTLHNYRTICPGALLMRDGTVCEKCLVGSPLWAVWHRCYRNSLPGSLAVARMVAIHRKLKTWHTKVNLFIALTEFSRSKFIAGNFAKNRIVVKSNFVTDTGYNKSNYRKGAIFVGRLSSEKGVATLIEAWQGTDYPLRIVGNGLLMIEAKALMPPNVQFLGRVSPQMVRAEMSKAAFLVLPSICYENFPMTIAEAYACELPVIVSRLGAMAEIVEDGVTGLHFTPGDSDDLAAKVRWAVEHPDKLLEMGRNARVEYEKKYTPERNCQELIDIYQQAIVEFKKNGIVNLDRRKTQIG